MDASESDCPQLIAIVNQKMVIINRMEDSPQWGVKVCENNSQHWSK